MNRANLEGPLARRAFAGAILLAGLGYSAVAFGDLAFLSVTGRLGPGFFPRVIGLLLVLTAGWSLLSEFRGRAEEPAVGSDQLAPAAVGLLLVGYLLVMQLLGAWLGTVLFMAASLSLLDPGRHGRNLVLSLVVASGLVLLFRFWLNAALPRGSLGIGF